MPSSTLSQNPIENSPLQIVPEEGAGERRKPLTNGVGLGVSAIKTGWPAPALCQDDDRKLVRWFASKPDARLRVREAAAAIEDACYFCACGERDRARLETRA
jgi:hypothetical protein